MLVGARFDRSIFLKLKESKTLCSPAHPLSLEVDRYDCKACSLNVLHGDHRKGDVIVEATG